ncbi:maltotransferase domain-containing protein [Mangrovivirga cuniculi]|uniref:maltotransferase domain-containing protein n=1 Tax=Mangrovivirga cuniculi TaxID=2715131 RepID=UPI001FE5AEAE|nr:maltotransferase domain-containing protein [Mangrovivirga cuniculi]
MRNYKGQSRVIIESVIPEINNGQYYAKGIVGKKIRVECDLFGDGHDVVNGSLLYKHKNARSWSETPLIFDINDHWFADFVPEKQGIFEFKLEGWVDHALNWQYELKRKVEGKQPVNVELLDGVNYLNNILKKASKTDKKYLEKGIQLFNEGIQNPETIEYALGDKLLYLFKKYPVKEFKTIYDNDLKVYVDRQKALFSSWYEFFPRSAGDYTDTHGTFKDCIKRLPYVAELGFDVLYLPRYIL